jgi:hypothetical protein
MSAPITPPRESREPSTPSKPNKQFTKKLHGNEFVYQTPKRKPKAINLLIRKKGTGGAFKTPPRIGQLFMTLNYRKCPDRPTRKRLYRTPINKRAVKTCSPINKNLWRLGSRVTQGSRVMKLAILPFPNLNSKGHKGSNVVR